MQEPVVEEKFRFPRQTKEQPEAQLAFIALPLLTFMLLHRHHHLNLFKLVNNKIRFASP